jgi:hypothetical protein
METPVIEHQGESSIVEMPKDAIHYIVLGKNTYDSGYSVIWARHPQTGCVFRDQSSVNDAVFDSANMYASIHIVKVVLPIT